jgi:hypothetical protein
MGFQLEYQLLSLMPPWSLHATPEAPATAITKTIADHQFTPAVEGGGCPIVDGDGGESAHFPFFSFFPCGFLPT